MAFSPAFFLLGVPGTVFGFLASDGAPTVITSDDTIDVDPGDTVVVTVTATGTGTMTFSIVPGGGAYGFQINSSSGALSFKNPAGVGVSTVTVKAESIWGSDTQLITVTVGAAYHADAVHFDGTASLTIASLTAPGDNTGFFTSSYWLKGFVNGGVLFVVDPADTFTNQAYAQTDHIYTDLTDATANESCNLRPTETITAGWHNLLISAQTNLGAGLKIRHAYLDDVALTLGAESSAAFLMTFNGLPFFAFDDSFGDFWTGDIADFWIAPGQYIDFSVQANRRKFISATSKPVDLGAAGATPTGTAPAIFFSGDATGFVTNKGTGGAFTLTSSLTNASTSPSD